MPELHEMPPEEVAMYLERLQAAQTMTSAGGAPPPDLMELSQQYMEAHGVRLYFSRVLDNDQGVVWEVTAVTPRGEVVERPDAGEDWLDFLLRQGWLPKGGR